MFAIKISFLATAICLQATTAQSEVSEELLDFLGLFPSSYDYAGRAFLPKQNANYLDEEDQLLVDMAELERAVTTTLTAAQMASSITAATLANIRAVQWDVEKPFQGQYTNVPYSAGGSSMTMRVELRSGTIKGLGSLVNQTATLNKAANMLNMRMGLQNVYVDADYTTSVPASGAAPADSASGHVQVKLAQAWVDAGVSVDDNGLPLNIQSFVAKSSVPIVTQTTNLAGNKYGPIYTTAFGEALRQVTENMLESNLKVKFNQALQAIKAAGTY